VAILCSIRPKQLFVSLEHIAVLNVLLFIMPQLGVLSLDSSMRWLEATAGWRTNSNESFSSLAHFPTGPRNVTGCGGGNSKYSLWSDDLSSQYCSSRKAKAAAAPQAACGTPPPSKSTALSWPGFLTGRPINYTILMSIFSHLVLNLRTSNNYTTRRT
jgi:hypothetical protein